MRVDSSRVVHLSMPPQEAWALLQTSEGLSETVPEIRSADFSRSGVLSLVFRIGRRRRCVRARTVRREEGRVWELRSVSPATGFSLRLAVQPDPGGSVIRVSLSFAPPHAGTASRKAGAAERALLLRRMALSAALFGLSAAGLLVLPRLALPARAAAVVWAVLSVLFLAAVSLLTRAHRRPSPSRTPA